ncbi:MAG: GGDEF domain-containing protein [Gammaproteobacteria bacterium]
MNVRRHRGIIWRWASLGLDEDDSPDLQLKKSVMTIVSTSIASLAIFWGSLYIYSGYPWAGAIPLSYSLISLSSTLHLLILLLPFLLMWRLGGFANGSVVMIWGFFAPLAALFFIDLKAAARWMLAYIILLSFSAIFDHHFATLARQMPATLNTVYFVMNTGCGFTLIALALYYFVKDRERAYEQLRQNEIHIRELMLTDPLTGVPNRRHLDNRLAMELSRQTRYGQPLAIIMTDIDLFKRVNDSYGHAMGDKVLRDFAACLQENIRESDFLARFGGEEFVLLLPNSTEKEAQTMAERMRSAVKALHFEIPSLHITSSFGVTLTRQGEDMSAVLDRVDKAMYMSKTRGRDCVTLLRT